MKCCVCGASDSEVALFSFPKAEPCRAEWKTFAGIQEQDVQKYSRICQKHFRKDDISMEMHRKRVKKNVAPSLHCESFDNILTNQFCMACKTTAKRVHFKFPENPEKRNEWLKICGYTTDFFNGDKHWYLCSRHFDQSVISKRGSAKSNARLRSNAVPTLFLAASESNSESICNVKETVDGSVDYSRIPTKILPKISGGNPEIQPNALLVGPSAECTPSTSLTTAAVCSTINNEEQHSPLIINPNDILDISMELSDDSVTEITSSTPPQPTVESSTPPQPTAESFTPLQPMAESSTPSTYVINSIHDYTSPTTISKILLLHKNSNCVECEAFKHHIHNSLNGVSCSQVTPVPRKPVKRSLRYPGDISTPDFATPKRARRSVNFLKNQVANYRKKVDVLNKRNARLKKTIKKYDDLMTHLKQKDMLSDSAYHTLSECFPVSMKQLLERQLERPSAQYPKELRAFALTLQFYSAKAYNYVRSVWCNSLPHEATLRKWYGRIDGAPGFTKESFAALRAKTEIRKEKTLENGEIETTIEINPVACVLVVDKISIKDHIENDRNTTYGYENLGSDLSEVSDQVPKALHSLVFLLNSLKEGWKVPVGYFLINSLSGAERANLITLCLQQLEEVHVHVVALTFDGTACNIQMCEKLGAKFDYHKETDACFPHPTTNEPIYIYPDPVHMIKLVRNTLGEKGPLFDAEHKSISWDYIRWLYEIEEEHGLRAGTKLTHRHIAFKDNKMNARLAIQVLSDSVGDALMWLKDDIRDNNFKDSEATSKFCKNFNNIFDMLNVRSKFSRKPYEQVVSNKEKDRFLQRVQQFTTYIEGLSFDKEGKFKVINSQRKTGFKGLVIAMRNVFKIFERIQSIPGMKQEYLLTYKLLQDCLENFFSAIRSFGGFNNSPTARSFQYAYKRLLVHHEIATNGNCALDNIQILHAANHQSHHSTTDAICNVKSDGTDLDIDDVISKCKKKIPEMKVLSRVVEDVNAHIAGFIARKLTKKTKNFCQHCAKEVLGPTTEFASKLTAKKNRYCLLNPSRDMMKITMKCEQIFQQYKHLVHLPQLKELLITKLFGAVAENVFNSIDMRNHILEQEMFSDHKTKLIKLVARIYFELRLHHECRQLNVKKTYKRRKNTASTTIYNHE